ncbi:hypothetical protein CTEN210_12041 [Chaetoceros tenuissimus]|uniref:F-box domain-containing protein n=1 Tax=Chaetoceros tenuissimus TaxID=426638 RepID=A0AAD3H9P6_9STRA|nr:hypothetical protein CTEN210_12041 [Chaetoceros tenuissimus]
MQRKQNENAAKNAKKHKALTTNGRSEIKNSTKRVTIYSLPEELLQKCFSYVGKGHYGLVGLVSRRFRRHYIAAFGKTIYIGGKKKFIGIGITSYLEMATSVKLANFCLNELCPLPKDKDEMLRAAAVNGNLDILRAAVKDGYDLFPLVEMKKETLYGNEHNWGYSYYDENLHGHLSQIELDNFAIDVYFTDEDEKQSTWNTRIVKLSKLVERGHLHVLQFLHEEFKNGLQRYCKPAIQHGQLEILDWLYTMGYMNPNDKLYKLFDFCSCAVKAGNVQALEWLLSKDFHLDEDLEVELMGDAIRSKSTEMIQYCFDLDFAFHPRHVEAIRETKCLDVYRKVHELGFEFGELRKWYNQRKPWEIKDCFEIIKFLVSMSIPWSKKVMTDILQHGTIEMIRDAHAQGCPWSTPEGFYACLSSEHSSLEKCTFLMENGCQFDYELSIDYELSFVRKVLEKKDLSLLGLFVGNDSNFDNTLFKSIVKCGDTLWLEGIASVLEKGKEIQNFASIEEVFATCQNIKGIKYFQSLGLPWTLDNAANTLLLSKIACFNELEDVKWAYENGCKGGPLVPFVREDWVSSGIRQREEWKKNLKFFEEKGLLASMDIQKIGDAQLDSKYSSRSSMFFRIDYASLKSLVDRGYAFRSESEKDSITKEALEKCYKHSIHHNIRKKLALFQKMGVQRVIDHE